MSKTKIEWTDRRWNPCTGCSKVSAGCKHCYAEGIANRFWGDRKFTDVQCHDDRLEQPLHWRKPSMVFVNSMSDLFHEDVPFEFIDKVFRIMSQTKHIYQILTKRPERALEYHNSRTPIREDKPNYWDKHYWLGVSVENQETADERIPILLQIPAAVRWLSCEPLLGAVDLKQVGLNEINYKALFPETSKCFPHTEFNSFDCLAGDYKIHWVVCGAESGHGARPMELEWALSLKDQCKSAGVPFFMKQICNNGKKIIFNNFPPELQVREYPERG